jgi:hypothetical protein
MHHATPLAQNVVRRFLSRNVLSDDRFQPPLGVVNAVDEGNLDTKVLLIWKAVIDNLLTGSHPPSNRGKLYGAATEYWRSKCAKNGIALPKEFQKGSMGGEGGEGKWACRPGDQVEEWVKQRLLSEGLISTLGKSVAEWQIDIKSLNDYIADAQERVAKHTEGMAKAKSQAGVAQKQKWLAGAKKELEDFSAQLAKAQTKMQELLDAANKKPEVENYSIEFEKEFQFMMNQALKEMDKKQVIDAVKKATERFEQGLDIPDTEVKTAGLLDAISSVLVKAWNHLKGAFELLIDWALGLEKDTKKIEGLLKSA